MCDGHRGFPSDTNRNAKGPVGRLTRRGGPGSTWGRSASLDDVSGVAARIGYSRPITHTLIYCGWYEHGFRRFHHKQGRYWRKSDPPDEEGHKVELPDDEIFDGIDSGFFETSTGFLFVSADDLTLPNPTLFIPGRHGVKGPGPSFPELDDDAAAAILVDMIVTNPGLRDELGSKLRSLPS